MYRCMSLGTMPFVCLVTITACSRPADSDVNTAAASEAPAAAMPSAATLESLKTANERFNDVNVALAEGYIADPTGMCVTADMTGDPAAAGAMGLHYFRPDLLGLNPPPEGASDAPPARVSGTGMYQDFTKPAILMYEPQMDGSMKLVGIENLVWTAAWQEAGHTEPPMFEGQPWFQMTDDPATPVDEAHGFESHYDLHVWLYRDNPTGAFAQFNPAVSCEHGQHPMPGM